MPIKLLNEVSLPECYWKSHGCTLLEDPEYGGCKGCMLYVIGEDGIVYKGNFEEILDGVAAILVEEI